MLSITLSLRDIKTCFQDRAEIQHQDDDDDCFTLKVGEPWQTSVSDLLRPIKTELGVVSRVTTCYKDLVQGLDQHEESQSLVCFSESQFFISFKTQLLKEKTLAKYLQFQ